MKSLFIVLALFLSTTALSITELTETTIQQELQGMTGLAYYYADWCPYCTEMTVVLEKLEKEFPKLKFTKVNIDEVQSGYKRVRTVPTVDFYKNGVLQAFAEGGAREEDARKFLKNFFKD